MKNGFSIVVAGCLLALVAGCSQAGPEVVPVSGKLMVNGRPAAGATVFFHPQGSTEEVPSNPLAVVQDDGTFRPSTFNKNDGLVAGEYALTVVWPKRTVVEGEEIEGPDQLRGRYAQPSTPVTTVKVEAEPVELPPLELTAR